MGKVCDNSRREAILHVTQNAAKPITLPQQEFTSRDLDQPKRHPPKASLPENSNQHRDGLWPCFA
jgi:hypothetical protein